MRKFLDKLFGLDRFAAEMRVMDVNRQLRLEEIRKELLARIDQLRAPQRPAAATVKQEPNGITPAMRDRVPGLTPELAKEIDWDRLGI